MMVAMDITYNLQDQVTPVIGCFEGHAGVVVGLRRRELDQRQIITVRFRGVHKPVDYLPNDIVPAALYGEDPGDYVENDMSSERAPS